MYQNTSECQNKHTLDEGADTSESHVIICTKATYICSTISLS